jgi:hypothetical protein
MVDVRTVKKSSQHAARMWFVHLLSNSDESEDSLT